MKEYREDNGTYLEGHHPSSKRSPSGVASGATKAQGVESRSQEALVGGE